MLETEEFVVIRRVDDLRLLSHCSRERWNNYLHHIARRGGESAYEVIAEGLTREQAKQLVALTKEGDEDECEQR